MSDDHTQWFIYADENLAVARLALGSGFYNACLQNIQQAVEKFLKAALLVQNEPLQKTHNIETLFRQVVASGVEVELSEEDCELLDSIYIPSKYPSGSVLPEFSPDKEIGIQCIEMAERVRKKVQDLV
ncbi:MAG: DNA-binding protein [Deltaproteobacteria bacterium]|nr:MAG: DNA-binding protein [Deltaproteobacteria bacterium]